MNRTFKPNRQGITLLFVISMIVLFLLMGTAFVIVANDFFRESKNRIGSNVAEGRGTQQSNAQLEEAMLQVIRGVGLRDIDSPLRVSDMLSDQYGFGVKAYVTATPPPSYAGGAGIDSPFIDIILTSDPLDADPKDNKNEAIDFLSEISVPLSPNGLSGTFGGRVLSFTSGPAKGFSVRILADSFNANGDLVFRIPTSSANSDVIGLSEAELIASLPRSEVIINGRDFSGFGAAYNDTTTPPSLGTEAQSPNRLGESFASLTANFLNNSNSVNEPWDAADAGTPFLAGFDKGGNLIPSFFRRALMENGAASSSGRNFFHAFDEGGDNQPDVDTDGSGDPDAFWMDLGMSISTDRQGRRLKPLFAIQIRDMDGLLNVNAHSNLSHLDSAAPFGQVDTEQEWASNTVGVSGNQPGTPIGSGVGTAEINLSNALGGVDVLEEILNARYGDDNLPGDTVNDPFLAFRSRAKLFGHPTDVINPNAGNFGTVGGLYSTALDINGRFRIGSPLTTNSGFDDFRDPNPRYINFQNGLPQINMLASDEPTLVDFNTNPYEMSLSGIASGDSPFTPQELERLLRPNDIDSSLLSDRLAEIVTQNTELFTTASFDVPMLQVSFVEELDRILQSQFGQTDDTARTNLINNGLNQQLAFAPELYFGLKMDINRPFGDGRDGDDNNNNRNGVVDEPGEAEFASNAEAAAGIFDGQAAEESQMDLNYSGARDANEDAPNSNSRVIYARNLYMLAMLLLGPVQNDVNEDGSVDATDAAEFAKAMAQWAVNVVDFRDPDSIHTRFVYDPTPFDANGWNPVFDTLNGTEITTPAPFEVWGCERPELLLTETLAVHIQNRERNSDPRPAYEQRLRPEPFAYLEVYNPWTQNGLNQRFPAELYDGKPGVDLGLMAGNSPVWRFEVERNEGTDFKPLRYVYVADPTGNLSTGDPISYADAEENQTAADIEIFFGGSGGAIVRPGSQAVIGTRGFADPDDNTSYRVFMGRKTSADDRILNEDELKEELNDTTRLTLNATAGTVRRHIGDTPDPIDTNDRRNTSVVFIDRAATATTTDPPEDRKFSLSDPYEGYEAREIALGITGTDIDDGFVYDSALSTSMDAESKNLTDDEIRLVVRTQDGISKNFRYVRLQRLANPLIEWNAVTNPYLTIDSMEVDLVSINGADSEDMSLPAAGQTQAVSHERGDTEHNLWGFQRENLIRGGTAEDSLDHFYARAFTESLGRTNDAFFTDINNPDTDRTPFPWLSWNNRPFVSHMEIMNVPYLAPERLTYAPETSNSTFTIDDGTVTDPYTEIRPGALAGRYGHLLNFFAGDIGGTNTLADAYLLLDYIEVPSRFVGNESWYLANGVSGVLKHPFNTISHYRVPGKININTIPPTNSIVWNALTAEYQASTSWPQLVESLYGNHQARDLDSGTGGPTGATDFENPFRPATAYHLVPGGPATTTNGSACGLLRPDASASAPLFDYNSANPSDNSARSAAFRNGFRTRLANMVTTKSSVFACWITVGYFEVDENDELVETDGTIIASNPPGTPAAGTVAEVGADTGEQVRNRAFFIFDRSIPVAFEPGKNHNVEDGILVKSLQINF